ncbi:uncharacterized protein PpBr36_10012 [Pyricularia pennisetigena]|uniref:uncharacterized protein n=1 Tax=Pyricularia pennisetigena TaxID=1578925 RepID=UPI001153AFE7|nr:uncharacterized protein PpBr36_10012 [Pyricularia pennisetigena]TLS22175.1 hypothetical protein PpBr36_10012 [Pyricularia pennisetigena]
MAGTHRGLSMHPDLANESELSIARDQHSRNARNADYKAMLNARVAVKRTVGYSVASDQEKERLLQAAMAEASARRLQNRQDHDSKMADFDNGIRKKKTSVPIKAFLESTAAANRRGQALPSMDTEKFATSRAATGHPLYPTPSTAFSAIFRSIEAVPRGPGMANAPLEPVQVMDISRPPSTRSFARRTTGMTSKTRTTGETASAASMAQDSRTSSSAESVSPCSGQRVTIKRPSMVATSTQPDSPPISLSNHERGPASVSSMGSNDARAKKRKCTGTDDDASDDGKRLQPSMETQFEALRNVVQNLSGQMSQQRNSIEALQHRSSQPRDSGSGSPVVVYQSSSFNAQVQNLNQLAKAQHEAALTLIQLTYPRMAAALDRLNEATEAIVARVRASGVPEDEIASETGEFRIAMDCILDLLDGQNRVR